MTGSSFCDGTGFLLATTLYARPFPPLVPFSSSHISHLTLSSESPFLRTPQHPLSRCRYLPHPHLPSLQLDGRRRTTLEVVASSRLDHRCRPRSGGLGGSRVVVIQRWTLLLSTWTFVSFESSFRFVRVNEELFLIRVATSPFPLSAAA